MAKLQICIVLLMGLAMLSVAKPCYHGAYSNYPASDYSFIAYGQPYHPPYGYNDYNTYGSAIAAVQVHQAANQHHYTVDEEGPHHMKFIYQEAGYPQNYYPYY